MKKNTYENLSNEKLLKTKGFFRGAFIGLGIVALVALVIAIYILLAKPEKNISVAALLPLFMLPITFMPLAINLSLINKEIKARNLDK